VKPPRLAPPRPGPFFANTFFLVTRAIGGDFSSSRSIRAPMDVTESRFPERVNAAALPPLSGIQMVRSSEASPRSSYFPALPIHPWQNDSLADRSTFRPGPEPTPSQVSALKPPRKENFDLALAMSCATDFLRACCECNSRRLPNQPRWGNEAPRCCRHQLVRPRSRFRESLQKLLIPSSNPPPSVQN